ncbi:MAG: hypothetical protein F6K54_02495 [Okeania sp. SIO3B5]|uniref:hypothetical protein n=1 Tax=Okeania sp. SIO3B5 TaxID=2607811 RepID=UPI0013FFFC8B|nr:hypothetical protein [Okeania sp. SIO3B5]NEO52051.1 hypothetical protein [Okeania sp. SIO3B5]
MKTNRNSALINCITKVSKSYDYQALPIKISKQIIRKLDSAWSSYFVALKAWQK